MHCLLVKNFQTESEESEFFWSHADQDLPEQKPRFFGPGVYLEGPNMFILFEKSLIFDSRQMVRINIDPSSDELMIFISECKYAPSLTNVPDRKHICHHDEQGSFIYCF